MSAKRRPAEGDEWQPWPLLTKDQIEESPSFRAGMSFKAERRLRENACKVIGEAGKTLDQGIVSIATAQVYLTRFFACKPYQRNDSFIVAVAALFVASKTENKPRPLHQIAHACWKHWVQMWCKEQKKRYKDQPASDWDQLAAQEYSRYRDPAWYKRFAEAITRAERVLLYTTGFQFNVHTGFYFLLGCKQYLSMHSDPAVVSFFSELNLQLGASSLNRTVSPYTALLKTSAVQFVWNFVIECYQRTRICLQFDPRTIGIACYERTCTQLNRQIPLVGGERWWQYVAKIHGWPLSIGDPRAVSDVQNELMKVFQPKLSKGAKTAAPKNSDWGSQPSTPNLQNGALTPSASPLPTLPQPGPSPSGDGGDATQNGEPRPHQMNGSSHPPALEQPPPLPAGSPLNATSESLQKLPTAQVKQKQNSQSLHFSPSNEFSASPKKAAVDSMAAPDLLEPTGNHDVRFSNPPKLTDDSVRLARLEKAKALGGGVKRKAEDSAENSQPPKLLEESPDGNFGVEFEP